MLLLLWGLLSKLELINDYLIPSPEKVLREGWRLTLSGSLPHHIAVSLRRVFIGYGITVSIALPLALFLHRRIRWMERSSFLLSFLRATPPLALIPLLILWFGIGESSKIAVIVLAAFFPIFLNAFDGFQQVDTRWHELAATLNLSGFDRLRFILLPGAFPHIVTGLRIGFGYSWRALVGAELFAAASGLGYLILDSQEMARTDRVLVGILAIGVLGFIFEGILGAITLRLSPWTAEQSKERL